MYQYAEMFDRIYLEVSSSDIFGGTKEEDWLLEKNIFSKIYIEEKYDAPWDDLQIKNFITFLDKTISCKLSVCNFNLKNYLTKHPIE
jgi:hypothetical protein